MILGLMERFNYPNLAAVYAEDSIILKMLETESYGYKRDQQEELEAQELEVEQQQLEIERSKNA